MVLKNKDNKSLILYTSLIFIVAIVMIIVSFFAQTHLDQSKVSEVDEEKVTLSNKAAQVSEENMQLVELNKAIREKNTNLTEENDSLKTELDAAKKQASDCSALLEVSEKLISGNKKAAKTILESINKEALLPELQAYYEMLVKKTE